MSEAEKTIDIEKTFRSSKSPFLRSLPGFVIGMVERFIRQDEMNLSIYNSRHLKGVPFVNDVLEKWNVKVVIRGGENVPAAGRFIFAGNHPVGGIDALAFYSTIYRFFPDVVSPTNEMLNLIPNMRPVMLGINVFGRNTREKAAKIEELFQSDTQIMIFPAGEVSRKQKGIISDTVWQKTFITKAIQYKRDVIPVHISGRNSRLFYFVANLRKSLGIRTYIETAFLPREMMSQRNSTVTLTIGKPIRYDSFTEARSHSEWAGEVKRIVYSLPGI